MGTSKELEQLCASWRDQLAEATRTGQTKYARRFLALLGWTKPPLLNPDEDPVSGPPAFRLEAGGRSVAAYFVPPGLLDPPAAVFEKGLDFCAATRAFVDGAYCHNVHYVFITDMFRFYLYDMRTEELLLSANAPDEFQRELGPALNHADAAQGSLDELRRQPRSYLARQLREWSQRWAKTLADATNQSAETTTLLVDRMVVLRFLLDRGVIKRGGRRLRERLGQLCQRALTKNEDGCGKGLASLCHDIYFDWKAEIFAPAPDVDQCLERNDLAAGLLAEFSLLSRGKFIQPVILESFNFGPADEKARVRTIPEDDEDRRRMLQKTTADNVDALRIEVDLMDEGYRSVGHWFDAVVAVYEEIERDFDAQAAEKSPDDLFAWSEIDAQRPKALQDRFRYAAETGLVVYYATARQYRTARLMMYLHLIERYDRNRALFKRFPRLEASLTPRPKNYERNRNHPSEHDAGFG